MKVLSTVTIVASIVSTASGFTTTAPSSLSQSTTSTTTLGMGLFDFFSDDAKQARDAKRQAEIEEQERLQQEIIRRRSNPEMMEEYERKVQIRRELRMAGRDEEASQITAYEEEEDQEEQVESEDEATSTVSA